MTEAPANPEKIIVKYKHGVLESVVDIDSPHWKQVSGLLFGPNTYETWKWEYKQKGGILTKLLSVFKL